MVVVGGGQGCGVQQGCAPCRVPRGLRAGPGVPLITRQGEQGLGLDWLAVGGLAASWGGGGAELAWVAAWCRSAVHCPASNCAKRARQTGLGRVRTPHCQCRSMRGRRHQSFQARRLSSSVLAARMVPRAVDKAVLKRPRRKEGGCLYLKHFCWSTAWASMESKEASA